MTGRVSRVSSNERPRLPGLPPRFVPEALASVKDARQGEYPNRLIDRASMGVVGVVMISAGFALGVWGASERDRAVIEPVAATQHPLQVPPRVRAGVASAFAEQPTAPVPTCLANVTSTPSGARVLWDAKPIGVTPLYEASVPCGTATVELERKWFLRTTALITTRGDETVELSQRLQRRLRHLTVTTSAAAASVLINGYKGPRVQVPVNRTATVTIGHPGFAPRQIRIRMADMDQDVHVRLVPDKLSQQAAIGSTPLLVQRPNQPAPD